MIFRASIGDVTVLLDDEITPPPSTHATTCEPAPTRPCALFSALPDAEPAATDTEA